jgi:hypothetical protein
MLGSSGNGVFAKITWNPVVSKSAGFGGEDGKSKNGS